MYQNTSPRRLLVIEDNPTDTFLLRRALTQHGVEYQMFVAEDGEQAVEYLDQCGEEENPELIIVDLNLPKEDGIEVLTRCRQNHSLDQTQMVVMTSSDSPHERKRAEVLGIDAYLQKPMELKAFMAMGGVLRNLLDQPPTATTRLSAKRYSRDI